MIYSIIGMVKMHKEEKLSIWPIAAIPVAPRWVLDQVYHLFITERYGMRAHASWGSLNDDAGFMNQDAYDKFRLAKKITNCKRNWKRTKEHNRNQEKR